MSVLTYASKPHTLLSDSACSKTSFYTHAHIHKHTHTHTDTDKYTLAQSNWLIQYVKKLNAEKRNLFDSLSLAPLSSSEKHGWNMCSLDYMFELNRSCDLNWSAFPPHHFASSKQELGCCVFVFLLPTIVSCFIVGAMSSVWMLDS